MTVTIIDREGYIHARGLARRILRYESMLDVGVGMTPNLQGAGFQVCVDSFLPYLEALARKGGRRALLHAHWADALDMMPDDSIDLVVATDFIEHIPRDSGVEFLREASRVARKQVLIGSPVGDMPQSYSKGEPDFWGFYGNEEAQSHKSAWTLADFPEEEGWEVWVCPDFHTVDAKGNELPTPVDAFWALRDVA